MPPMPPLFLCAFFGARLLSAEECGSKAAIEAGDDLASFMAFGSGEWKGSRSAPESARGESSVSLNEMSSLDEMRWAIPVMRGVANVSVYAEVDGAPTWSDYKVKLRHGVLTLGGLSWGSRYVRLNFRRYKCYLKEWTHRPYLLALGDRACSTANFMPSPGIHMSFPSREAQEQWSDALEAHLKLGERQAHPGGQKAFQLSGIMAFRIHAADW